MGVTKTWLGGPPRVWSRAKTQEDIKSDAEQRDGDSLELSAYCDWFS